MRPDQIKRIIQKERHCGPAVMEMLYSFYGLNISQTEVATATGLELEQIMLNGCSILSLTHAVNRLDNGYTLLVKYDSAVDDVMHLVDERSLPVGVEWRCEFLEPHGVLWGEGHYSIIVGTDPARGTLHLADPFNGENISHRNGIIGIEDFQKRWWDENWFPVAGEPGTSEQIFTEGLIFILISQELEAEFRALGFQPMTPELPAAHRRSARVIQLPTHPDEVRAVIESDK